MTLLVGDIASYQGGLALGQLRAAGYGGVNFKISHGVGQKSVHPNLPALLAEARAGGWRVSTFHWLTGDVSGADQAGYAFQRLTDLDLVAPGPGTGGFAHVVDVESAGVTAAHVAAYCTTMTRLLGRPITLYTGDWYWPRLDMPNGADFAPWLWAAPNDASRSWTAGYGGWTELAAMQYEVVAVAGVQVSTSAVRSEDVWRAMAGEPMTEFVVVKSLNNLLAEINAIAPDRDKASDGAVGDQAHATGPSSHNPDETGVPEDRDADSINEVRGRDFDADLRRPGLTMEMVCQYLVAGCRAARITWIKYIIFNKRIWAASDGFVQRPYSGSNPHDKHMHVSCKPDTASENNVKPLGLASLIEAPKEPDVELNDKIGDKTNPARTVGDVFRDVANLRAWLLGETVAGFTVPSSAPAYTLKRVGNEWGQVRADLSAERAEVPPTPPSAENIAAAVMASLAKMPEVVVELEPADLQAAIVAAVHQVTQPLANADDH